MLEQRRGGGQGTAVPPGWSLPSRNRAAGTSDGRGASEGMCSSKKRRIICLEIYSYGKSYDSLRISQMHLGELSQQSHRA